MNETEIIEQFRQAMREKGVVIHGEIIADGKIHRYHVDGQRKGSKNGWAVLHLDDHPAGAFGCAKQYGVEHKFTWTAKGVKNLTAQERSALRAKAEQRRLEREAQERARHEAAAKRSQALWEAAAECNDHPYLKRKGVKSYGLRVGKWEVVNPETGEVSVVSDKALLVPLRDTAKAIHSLQAIFPSNKNLLKRDKDYFKDGAKAGLFFTIGKPVDRTFLICEGYATGASLHECTGHAVVVAFDAGNLLPVGQVLRAKFPDYRIVYAADNDQWTEKPVPNPGVTKAREAAKAVGGLVVIPEFTDLSARPTDFNDLHVLAGALAVKDAIEAAINPPPAAKLESDDLPPWEEDSAPPARDPEDSSTPLPPDTSDDFADDDGQMSDNPYFSILGYDREEYFFFQREKKQITTYTKGDFTDTGFIALAPLNWWEMNYPAGSKEGGINKKMAANALIRIAIARGIYDVSRVRGRGAWIDEGRVVFHHGGHLSVDGVKTDITRIESRYVYELDRPMPEPADTPLTDEEGRALLETAKMFRWTKPGSAALLAGWVALAPLCGALRWRPHIWLTGGPGSGKAQPHTAKVLTPTGWRTMGDLQVGDMVSTPDNGCARVCGKYPQGTQPVYKITFADGRTTRATADHLWKVRIKRDWRIRTTAEMVEIINRNKKEFAKRLAVPLCEPMTVRNGGSALMLPLHPYVLGIMLGDGSFGNVYGTERTGTNLLTCFDPEIVARARVALENSPLNFFDTNVDGRFRLGDLSRYGRQTQETIKELRLLGTKSETKFIPRAYLDASIEDRIELLKGLMDTDGHAGEGGSVSYCTTSPMLRDGMVELVRSLGGIASVSEKKPSFFYKGDKKAGRLAYNVDIRFKDPTIAFSLPRKLARVSPDHQYADCLYLNVVSIVEDGEEECSCIAIDHPDRLYVTDNFVVTHNTTVLNEYVFTLMNGMAVYAQGNSTEAGIRQTLRADARPVLFDESEQNDDREKNRVQSVISLIRQASTESQAQTLKGTAGGEAMAFHIRSMFCLASVQVGMKHQADIERMTVLALRPKREDADAGGTWKKISSALYNITRDETMPSRLFRRMLSLLPVIRQNISVFVEVAANRFGSQRDGDQYGTLLAGAWALCSDKPVTLAQAEQMIDSYDWSEHLENQETDDSQRALAALMEAHVRINGGSVLTVYELVAAALNRPGEGVGLSSGGADAVLQRHGMRVKDGRLLLSNTSQELRRLMLDTSFEADLRGILLRVPGADRYDNKTIKFNGVGSKCISLPLDNILDDNEGYVAF